jgi:hypothetical protein
VLLLVGGFLGVVFARRQRTRRLRERFGPEYERTVDHLGDQDKAEEELQARVEHVESLDIKPLSQEQKERFAQEWRVTQEKFVDEPVVAIQEANRLVREVMREKGYPVDDFEQRAADISVDYPELVTNYRGMHTIASRSEQEDVSTEEMRQAMVHCRALFEELLGTQVHENMKKKETI